MHATRKLTLALSAIIPLALTGTSLAQSFSDSSRSRPSRAPALSATAMRPSVINLEQQARLRRPGQIVRGDRVEVSPSMASALDAASDLQPLNAPRARTGGDAVHEPLIPLHEGPLPSPSELTNSDAITAPNQDAPAIAPSPANEAPIENATITSDSRSVTSAESINAMSEQTARDYPQGYAAQQPALGASDGYAAVSSEPAEVVFERADVPTLSTPSADAELAAAMSDRPASIATEDEVPMHSSPAAPLDRPTNLPTIASSSAVRIEDVTAWSDEDRALALRVHEPSASAYVPTEQPSPEIAATTAPHAQAIPQADAQPVAAPSHDIEPALPSSPASSSATLAGPAVIDETPTPTPTAAPSSEPAQEPIEIAIDDMPEMHMDAPDEIDVAATQPDAPAAPEAHSLAAPPAPTPSSEPQPPAYPSSPTERSALTTASSLDAMIDSIVNAPSPAPIPASAANTPATPVATPPVSAASAPATAAAAAPVAPAPVAPIRIVSSPAVAPAASSAPPAPITPPALSTPVAPAAPIAASASAPAPTPAPAPIASPTAGSSSIRPPVIDPQSGLPTRIVSTPAPSPAPAPTPVTSPAAASSDVASSNSPAPSQVERVVPIVPESARAVREPVIALDRDAIEKPTLNQPVLNVPARHQAALDQPVLDQPALDPRELTWRQTGARVRVVSVIGSANNAQWRLVHGAGDGAWLRLREGDELNGEVEVRTGVGASVQLDVDGRTQVEVDRLTRAQITRAVPSKGVAAAGVQLDRGRVVVRPSNDPANAELSAARRACLARVQTPDQLVDVRTEASVEYSAFVGTRQAAAE